MYICKFSEILWALAIGSCWVELRLCIGLCNRDLKLRVQCFQPLFFALHGAFKASLDAHRR